MFSSSLKWYSSIFVFLLLSCANKQTTDTFVIGSETDGFTVQMPYEPDRQETKLDIHGHEVDLRVHLIGDSGVMFGATFFDIPPSLMEYQEEERADLLWKFFTERTNALPMEGNGPLGEDGPAMRNGWMQEDEGSRMGVAVLLNDHKAAVLYTGTPIEFHDAAAERKMIAYFRSLKVHGR